MFSLEDIISATRGKVVQGPDQALVTGVSIDSRNIKTGDVFIAIKGERFDGHDFIDQVQDKAPVIIVGAGFKPARKGLKSTVIKVKNTLKALMDLAGFHRHRCALPIIAITGSTGKTTTKEMIAAVLGEQYEILKNPSSFNNAIGVSLTLLQLQHHHDIAVLEVGTNQPGDIRPLAELIDPAVAVFTNIGPSHLQGLSTPEGVLKEKLQLKKAMGEQGYVVYNGDDKRLLKTFHEEVRALSYGIDYTADEQAFDVKMNAKGHYQFRLGRAQEFCLKSPVYVNVYNALAAITCGELFDVDYKTAAKGLSKVVFPEGRQNIKTIKGMKVINDTYNANPTSFESALNTLAHIPTKGKRYVLCGDMGELGKASAKWHKHIGALIKDLPIDGVWAIGSKMKYLVQELDGSGIKAKWYDPKSHKALIKAVKQKLKSGDVVLIKGSRFMQMEQFLKALKG